MLAQQRVLSRLGASRNTLRLPDSCRKTVAGNGSAPCPAGTVADPGGPV